MCGKHIVLEQLLTFLEVIHNLLMMLPGMYIDEYRQISTSRYLSIFADTRRYLSILVDICRYLSIFVDTRRYLSIFVDTRRYLSIFVDICRYSSILVDICRYLSILVDICRYRRYTFWGGGPIAELPEPCRQHESAF